MDVRNKKNLQDPVFSLRNKMKRLVWGLTYYSLFRFSPIPFFGFRRFLLRLFGAKIGLSCNIYPSVKIWLPANLELSNCATLGPGSTIYNQGFVSVGEKVTVSQGVFICASSHDYNDPVLPLILGPIEIESNSWICAEAFIGPGVTVKTGAVIGARAVLTKSADAWGVYAGNPASKIRERTVF